jgi:hypothetical protein
MRWFVGVVVVGALGCCLGGEDPPAPVAPPPPAAASPLSQALGEMGVVGDPNAAAVTTGDAPAAPIAPAAAPIAPAGASTPACADARAARDQVRADVAQLRLSLGAETSARLDAANRALLACNADPACIGDGRARVARAEAYAAAKAAHAAESTRLAEAEVGIFHADQAVAAACGAP